MVKQIVFSLALVAMVSQAHAIEAAKDGKGEAQAQRTRDEANKAKEQGGIVGAPAQKQIDMIKAGQKLDKLLGGIKAEDKEVIIKMSVEDKEVREALKELVKSRMNAKKTGSKDNDGIDGAQTNALQALAKIKDLEKKIASNSLSGTEKAVYNLIAKVVSKARADWTAENKAVATEALNIFGEAVRGGSTLDQAWVKMESDMANHKDSKLRANINKDAVEKWCS